MDGYLNCIIINGPNLNMLGHREAEFYGEKTLKEIENHLFRLSDRLHVQVQTFQSNKEGELVDYIQNSCQDVDGLLINPAALSGYGYSMLEALTAVKVPFIELHLSNIYAREQWHQKSIFSAKAIAVIAGMKDYVYEAGLRAMCHYMKEVKEKRRGTMKVEIAEHIGEPVKTKKFPVWPYSDDLELNNLKEVLESGNWWRMTGSKVKEFEKKFAKMHGTTYCLGISNGTHAIEVALNALGIGPGDEVIIPAFTFISTATAVIYCNAEPVCVDINPRTFCMDPDSFERAITPRTKAVIPVHMAGQPCDMEKICGIAKNHGIKVIEDAAHAHGTEWNHQKTGSFGDMAIFSFQNGKIVTCGEGGAIVTNNQELYEKAFLIHGVGRPDGDRVYEHKVLGSNDRMNEFQAAVLLAQLSRLDEHNKRREKNARRLDELLKDIPGIIPQSYDPGVTLNSHYMYMFYYQEDKFNHLSREEFVNRMNSEGIPCFVGYPVISHTRFYEEEAFAGRIKLRKKCCDDRIPNAVRVSKETVWLPHYTLLGDEKDLLEITMAILKIKGLS